MELTGMQQERGWVVTVKGRLDTLTAPEFEKRISEWMREGKTDFIADFSGLEYISSAGLRSLLVLGKKLKAQQGTLALCSLTPVVAKVFAISNFTALFPQYDSVEKALEALRESH